jgi:hypothetical protein
MAKMLFALSLAVFASLALTACDDDNAAGSVSGFVVGNDG